jgi:predicted dehydrogenase
MRLGTPTVALWGTGGSARAQAAACLVCGWKVSVVAAGSASTAAPLARELAAESISVEGLLARRRADLAILPSDIGDVSPAGPGDIGAMLERGYHLVLAPPLARTLADADKIVALADGAAANGQRVLYGDAVCASPVVDALFARLAAIGSRTTHISSRSIRPTGSATTRAELATPLLDHGVHSIAATLLAARLCDLGRPTGVTGERAATGDAVTEARLHFGSGDSFAVHASYESTPAPSWGLQVATPDEVLRVDLFPTPTLERNGDLQPVASGPDRADDPPYAFGFAPQLERFWSDVTAGRSPVLPAGFGRDVLEIVCAAHASVEFGAAVDLPYTGPRDRTPQELG